MVGDHDDNKLWIVVCVGSGRCGGSDLMVVVVVLMALVARLVLDTFSIYLCYSMFIYNQVFGRN